jgi:hypothetical protein
MLFSFREISTGCGFFPGIEIFFQYIQLFMRAFKAAAHGSRCNGGFSLSTTFIMAFAARTYGSVEVTIFSSTRIIEPSIVLPGLC